MVRVAVALLIGAAAGCSGGDSDAAAGTVQAGEGGPGGSGGVAGQGSSEAAGAGGQGSSAGGGSSFGAMAGLLGDEVYAGGCLDTLPQQTACDSEGLVCTYGAHPRTECRDLAICTEGSFFTENVICEPAPDDPSRCPSLMPNGASCTEDQQMCAYPDGSECLCMLSLGMWLCDVPRQSSNPDCPPIPPNAGEQCPEGTASCSYPCGVLSQYGVTTSCDAGVWTWAQFPCATTD